MPGIVLPTVKSLLGWYDITRYGALGNGSHDDTTAIQAAIDACGAGGGGTVYFPAGTYYLGTAPYAKGTGYTTDKAILHLPSHTADTGSAMITVRLYGGTAPPNLAWGANLAAPQATAGATLITDQNDGSTGTAGMVGCAAPTSSLLLTSGTYFSAINAIVEGIAFRTYDNPQISAIRLDRAACAGVFDVAVCSSSMTKATWTQPTHGGAVGIAMPLTFNAARNYLDRCLAINMYTGFLLTEHCRGGSLAAGQCMEAVHAGPATHGMAIHHLLTQSNANHLVIDQGGNPVIICVGLHETEVKTSSDISWLGATPKALLDVGNFGYGTIAYHNKFGSAGYAISGGTNFTLTNCGSTT